jgi:hypothetical protein
MEGSAGATPHRLLSWLFSRSFHQFVLVRYVARELYRQFENRTDVFTDIGASPRAQQRRNRRSAEQPPAEVAVWNHPIRVTTVHLAGSSVSTAVTPGWGRWRTWPTTVSSGRLRATTTAFSSNSTIAASGRQSNRRPRTAAAARTCRTVSSSAARHVRVSTKADGSHSSFLHDVGEPVERGILINCGLPAHPGKAPAPSSFRLASQGGGWAGRSGPAVPAGSSAKGGGLPGTATRSAG